MPRVSAAFFAVGVVYLLLGMAWGMHMGEAEDFTMMPAHAHLNLLGWVTMAIYGTFYALTHASLKPKLAWTNLRFASALATEACLMFTWASKSRGSISTIRSPAFTV
jgi:hypothetical protein